MALDANALDRDGSPNDTLVDRFLALAEAGRLGVFWPSGVVSEMLDPRSPGDVRARAALAPEPPRLRPGPTARQHIDRIRVRAILRGDGRPGKHDADAAHLSEAAEAGCSHFVTRDRKILRKRDTLGVALPAGFRIATLAELLSGFGRER